MKRLLLAGLLAFLPVTALADGNLADGNLAEADPADGDVVSAAAAEPTAKDGMTVMADDHVIGSAEAERELVIYASVTCGHCGDWFTDEWPTVKSELVETGKLRVALREFPTAPAQIAVAGFMIANCAGEDAYWPVIEKQFQTQDALREAFAAGKGREAFETLATEAGVEDLQACLSDDAQFARIDRSMARGEAAGVSAVPSFFLDGEALSGAHGASDLIAALD